MPRTTNRDIQTKWRDLTLNIKLPPYEYRRLTQSDRIEAVTSARKHYSGPASVARFAGARYAWFPDDCQEEGFSSPPRVDYLSFGFSDLWNHDYLHLRGFCADRLAASIAGQRLRACSRETESLKNPSSTRHCIRVVLASDPGNGTECLGGRHSRRTAKSRSWSVDLCSLTVQTFMNVQVRQSSPAKKSDENNNFVVPRMSPSIRPRKLCQKISQSNDLFVLCLRLFYSDFQSADILPCQRYCKNKNRGNPRLDKRVSMR
jgi:hypothetical protein